MDNTARDLIIAQLLSEGISLSDVQKKLESEHEMKITYMDLRLIASDLQVNWDKLDADKNKDAEKVDDISKLPDPADPTAAGGPAAAGGAQVTISKIVQPGAMISGSVVFKSGAKAEWHVDNMGRLGLNQEEGADKPTEDDLVDFQEALQREVQGKM